MAVQVKYALLPKGQTERVVFSSTDSNVATVSETGLITAIAIGSCSIVLKRLDGYGVIHDDVKAELSLTVIEVQEAISQIILSPTSLTMQLGGTVQIIEDPNPDAVHVDSIVATPNSITITMEDTIQLTEDS